MSKFWKPFSTYIISIVMIGTVVAACVYFLLDNLPYDDSVLNVNIKQKRIVVNNNMLMSDTLGKTISTENFKNGTTGYAEIEIKSNIDSKVKYEIVLNKEDVIPEVDSKFVKVYLTDFNDNAIVGYDTSNIPTYYDLKVSEMNPSSRIIYSGVLKNKGTVKFKIRMWVSDTYSVTVDSEIFSSKLSVNVK